MKRYKLILFIFVVAFFSCNDDPYYDDPYYNDDERYYSGLNSYLDYRITFPDGYQDVVFNYAYRKSNNHYKHYFLEEKGPYGQYLVGVEAVFSRNNAPLVALAFRDNNYFSEFPEEGDQIGALDYLIPEKGTYHFQDGGYFYVQFTEEDGQKTIFDTNINSYNPQRSYFRITHIESKFIHNRLHYTWVEGDFYIEREVLLNDELRLETFSGNFGTLFRDPPPL